MGAFFKFKIRWEIQKYTIKKKNLPFFYKFLCSLPAPYPDSQLSLKYKK